MTHPEQTTLLAEFYAEKKNVLKLKGEDYATETDVLQNFKTAGANIGISAELQCLSLIATKVARLGNLLTGKKPNNESVADSILDLSNYTDLLYCLVNEQITDVVNCKPTTKRCENVAPDEEYQLKVGDRYKNYRNQVFAIEEIKNKRVLIKVERWNFADWHDIYKIQREIKIGFLKKIN